jgi:hypothetical protein
MSAYSFCPHHTHVDPPQVAAIFRNSDTRNSDTHKLVGRSNRPGHPRSRTGDFPSPNGGCLATNGGCLATKRWVSGNHGNPLAPGGCLATQNGGRLATKTVGVWQPNGGCLATLWQPGGCLATQNGGCLATPTKASSHFKTWAAYPLRTPPRVRHWQPQNGGCLATRHLSPRIACPVSSCQLCRARGQVGWPRTADLRRVGSQARCGKRKETSCPRDEPGRGLTLTEQVIARNVARRYDD